jgi:phenylacetate-CoA ligase
MDKKIRDLVAHAYQNAPAVKERLDYAGISPDEIQGANDLKKIPVMNKDELIDLHQKNPPFGGFLTIDPNDLPRIYISPGPIFDPQPPSDDQESGLAPFKYVGFERGGPGNTDLQIMMALKLRATGFVGQPSYLMTILDKMVEMGITPETCPIKKALFSAEPYTPSQRERFEGEWGMKTTSAYGTADLGFLGFTADYASGFVLTSANYVQIVDTETGEDIPAGEIGEIVVTTFNKSYPLIRFGTGDLGAVGAELVEGQQHLLGLYGRSGDAIKVRGMFLHPNQLKMAAAQFPNIEKIQAVITRPENSDIVTIRVQLKDGAEANGVDEKLKELARNAVRLRIDEVLFVDEISSDERTVKDDRVWD